MSSNEDPFGEEGEDGSTVEFGFVPTEVNAGNALPINYTVEVADVDPNRNLNADVKAFLYVNGTADSVIVASERTTVEENDTVEGTLTHTFRTNSSRNQSIDDAQTGIDQTDDPRSKYNSYPRTDEPIWIKVEIDFWDNSQGWRRGNTDRTASTEAKSIEVKNPFDAPEEGESTEDVPSAGEDTLSSTFEGRTPFSIKEIEYEDDASYLQSIYNDDENTNTGYRISFNYPNPTVAIDTAGRFAKHEIIGGATVRQKIGEDPINVSISGTCKRRTANQIDSLRDAKHGKIYSDRLPGANDALRVQFGSTSTEPMTDGGAADLTDGRYLYSYQINCIEVIR